MIRRSIPRPAALLATGALVLTTAFGTIAEVRAQEGTRAFQVEGEGASRVQFVSDAPLERMTGVSSAVTGRLEIDTAAIRGSRGELRVPVASLRTGIDLRDQHLRGEGWLDAARHPDIVFRISGIDGAPRLVPDRETRLTVRGAITIRGVTRNVRASARVLYTPAQSSSGRPRDSRDAILVQATFTVRLTDFDITVPAVTRLKVANEIRVEVNVRATAVAPRGSTGNARGAAG